MIHGCPKNGACRPADWTDRKCKRGYPRDVCEHTTIDARGYAHYKRPPGSERVVPHNPYLLTRFQCHHNTELTATVNVVGYLYGYLSKGPDRLRSFISKKSGQPVGQSEDQILDYLTGRQVTCGEALWRIFGFGTNVRLPPVSPLNYDLAGRESVDPTNPGATITDLDRYFNRPGSPSSPVLLTAFDSNRNDSVARYAGETMEDVLFQDYFNNFSRGAKAPARSDQLPAVQDNVPGAKAQYVYRQLRPRWFNEVAPR
eukprot:gene3604-biopygen9122